MFSPSSEIASIPPIPSFFSLDSIRIVFSLATLGINLKFAGICPLPSFITSNTDVIFGAMNASNGVTEVFL